MAVEIFCDSKMIWNNLIQNACCKLFTRSVYVDYLQRTIGCTFTNTNYSELLDFAAQPSSKTHWHKEGVLLVICQAGVWCIAGILMGTF